MLLDLSEVNPMSLKIEYECFEARTLRNIPSTSPQRGGRTSYKPQIPRRIPEFVGHMKVKSGSHFGRLGRRHRLGRAIAADFLRAEAEL